MAGAAGASERGASIVNETYAGMGAVEDGRGASMVNETYAGMGGAAGGTYGAMQAFGGDSVTSALVRVC